MMGEKPFAASVKYSFHTVVVYRKDSQQQHYMKYFSKIKLLLKTTNIKGTKHRLK